MVVRHHVEGYEGFLKFMEQFPKDNIVHVLYSGTKLPNGSSWCPDCVVGETIYFIRNDITSNSDGSII